MKDIKKNSKLSPEEVERRQILAKAEETKQEQLQLDLNNGVRIEDEYTKLLDQQIDDPVQKYELYYKVLDKLVRANLPKGKENEPLRRIIYDEKNILINRGKKKDKAGKRGSDGRMSYMADLEMAIEVAMKWVQAKGSYFDLYLAFYNKNEELGYEHQE